MEVSPMTAKMNLSVIILLEEDTEDFIDFLRILQTILEATTQRFEILIIANGTEALLKRQLAVESLSDRRLRAISFPNRVSQAVCVRAGLKESRSDLIMTSSSYQQLTPESISEMLQAFNDDTDMIIPWRQKRVDPSFNQLQSRLFNHLVSAMTANPFHDLSCTIRLQRRQVLEEIPIYGNMYRFLPLLAKKRGFRIREIKCKHLQERGKTGFYSFIDYTVRILDILTLFFNTRYGRTPLRFFSLIGAIFLMAGLISGSWAFGQKLLFGIPIGNRPEVLMAVLFMVIGVQASGIGLLAEMVTFVMGRQRKEYTIEKII